MVQNAFSALSWQRTLYVNGFAGKRPKVPAQWHELYKAGKEVMSEKAFAYIAGGAGLEKTMEANRRGFEQLQIVPRMLQNVEQRNLSITLFGKLLPSPFLLSPIGVLEMVHSEADLAVARAAAAFHVPFIFSNQASVPMEQTAAAMGNSPRWFQLYWSKSDELVASLVQRAERSGCQAIVVTLDTTMLGWRPRDLNLGYLPFMEGKGIAQYTSDPVFMQLVREQLHQPQALETKPPITWQAIRGLWKMASAFPGNPLANMFSPLPRAAVRLFVNIYSRPSLTWENLRFLRQHTRLPIVLKGILHPEDARRAIDEGIDGIMVSNHGGRQVDGAIAAIDALPEIVQAVAGKIPVLMDSGIRSGADAFKALALGATAVGIGRPYAFGLAIGGERGVREVISHFLADLELNMALSGCKNILEVREATLKRRS
ncbi:MAG: alpha-hydroxy-acid oxidizing protein [Cytophagales bacterium]|nr:alpha-hydroxy-acid oxidizing protein [Bernardetiaceae bacterium]MDW8205405.1 alpha-hydroxy-acid oxidizing protein [Cytophagales bacterium]